MYLATDRLLLRPVEYPDVDQLVALWADPDVTRFAGGPRDPEQMRETLDEVIDSPPSGPFGLFALIEKASGAAIGHCGLLETQIAGAAEAELACVLAKRVWGRGYAAEIGEGLLDLAFRVLGLPRVASLIDPQDERAKGDAADLGMHFERRAGERELWVVDAPFYPDDIDAGVSPG